MNVLIKEDEMTVIFVSDFLNHHQKPLSDALYKELGDGCFYYIATSVISERREQMGFQTMAAPYVLKYEEGTRVLIDSLINDADVVIYGAAPLKTVKKRYNENKLTFCSSERRFKTISRYLKYPIYTLKSLTINKGFLLCASAFAAKDYCLSGMSLHKCLKWGYFTEERVYNDIDAVIRQKHGQISERKSIFILWAGRFLNWKHPEIAVSLAEKLNKEGYDFVLELIGVGKQEEKIRKMIEEKSLSTRVIMSGKRKPEEVRDKMEKADVFIFTSDRSEGWGAVLNESLNSACAVVASDAIGSVPYLVRDGENGLVFKNGNAEDLFRQVKFLIDNYEERIRIQKKAYETIINEWSPSIAARNFLSLVNSLLEGKINPIISGPCSSAPLLFDHLNRKKHVSP